MARTIAIVVFAHQSPAVWALTALCLLALGWILCPGARGARRWVVGALFAGAAVAALGAGLWAWSWHQLGPGTPEEDGYKVNSLTSAMDTFYATTGRYPTEAEGWSALVNPPDDLRPMLDRLPEDRFGRPVRYRIIEGRPCISADGRDGVPDTEDDVVGRRYRPDGQR